MNTYLSKFRRGLGVILGVAVLLQLYSCSNPASNPPPAASFTLPLFGGDSFTSTVTTPGYWANGTWVPLSVPSGETGGIVNAIVSAGSNIYAAGWCWTGAFVDTPGYWLNGTWVALPLAAGNPNGEVYWLAVSGSNVYAAGGCWSSSYSYTPGYWLNGIWSPLPVPSGVANGLVNWLVVSGTNVYAAGFCWTGSGLDTPGYWLNGTWTPLPLPSGATQACALTVAVSGTDVYVAGYCWTSGSTYSPGYWLNGIWTALPVPTANTSGGQVYSAYISGTNVYFAGEGITGTGQTRTYTPLYWLNGVATALPVPTSDAGGGWVNSIVVSGNNIVAAGGVSVAATSSAAEVPGYWLNGTWNVLAIPSTATSGYVDDASATLTKRGHIHP